MYQPHLCKWSKILRKLFIKGQLNWKICVSTCYVWAEWIEFISHIYLECASIKYLSDVHFSLSVEKKKENNFEALTSCVNGIIYKSGWMDNTHTKHNMYFEWRKYWKVSFLQSFFFFLSFIFPFNFSFFQILCTFLSWFKSIAHRSIKSFRTQSVFFPFTQFTHNVTCPTTLDQRLSLISFFHSFFPFIRCVHIQWKLSVLNLSFITSVTPLYWKIVNR